MHRDEQCDFSEYAEKAAELRRLRRWRPECQHMRVTVATRPYCSDCGLVLPLDHPLAEAALRWLQECHDQATGPLAEALGKVGG